MWSTLLLVAGAHAQRAAPVDFTCDGEVGALGASPLVVTCEAVPRATGTWDLIEWRTGTGEVVAGDSFTFTYYDPGQYTVTMLVHDFVRESETEAVSFDVRRDGAITVCGVPDPAFSITDKGGRDYQIVNLTTVEAAPCLETVGWEVREGGGEGQLLAAFETWEPRFQLDEDGTYNVVLTAWGIGGVTSTRVVFEAEYGLTEDYGRIESTTCATGPVGSGLLWALVPGLLVLRRRRS